MINVEGIRTTGKCQGCGRMSEEQVMIFGGHEECRNGCVSVCVACEDWLFRLLRPRVLKRIETAQREIMFGNPKGK